MVRICGDSSVRLYHKSEAVVVPSFTVDCEYLASINFSILPIATLILKVQCNTLESRAHENEQTGSTRDPHAFSIVGSFTSWENGRASISLAASSQSYFDFDKSLTPTPDHTGPSSRGSQARLPFENQWRGYCQPTSADGRPKRKSVLRGTAQSTGVPHPSWFRE